MDTLPNGQSSKSPAFSFYAKEWLAATLSWALDARGAYATLMAYQWDAGSVPGDDMAALGRVLGVSSTKARLIWSVVSSKFERGTDGHWRNARLEQERQKQAYRREALKLNGSKGGRPTKNQTPNQTETNRFSKQEPNENLNKSLSFTSSSSTSDPSKNDGSDAVPPAPATPPPLISGQAHPGQWGKVHSNHVAGFCEWVCLPEFIFEEFRTKSPGPEYVMGWARKVRAEWEGQTIGDDGIVFWRKRWSESHRTVSAKEPFSLAAAQARVKAGER